MSLRSPALTRTILVNGRYAGRVAPSVARVAVPAPRRRPHLEPATTPGDALAYFGDWWRPATAPVPAGVPAAPAEVSMAGLERFVDWWREPAPTPVTAPTAPVAALTLEGPRAAMYRDWWA